MPTYLYVALEGEPGCPACHRGLEIVHGMSDAAPTSCPRCGGRIRREFTAPGLPSKWNEKSLLSEGNLKRHGFKTLRNEGDGKFRVT